MNSYKIYTVKKYCNTPHCDAHAFISDNIDIIVSELQSDNSYHLLLHKNIKYSVFFDLDNVISDNQFQMFLRYIQSQYSLNIIDVSYTKSTSFKGLLSYHLVYPNYKGTLSSMVNLCSEIKNDDYYSDNFNGILDSSVYCNNRWFRLPNQTNFNKPNMHTIIKGSFKDFIFNYSDPKYLSDDESNDDNDSNDSDNNKSTKKYGINKIKYSDIYFQTKYNYLIDDLVVQQCLDNLDDSFLENWQDWIKVTNCLKCLNKKHLWNKWSKNGSSYNYLNNMKQWKSQKDYFSFEWLLNVSKLNINNIKKPYTPMTKQIFHVKNMNNNRVFDKDYKYYQFTYNDFVNNKFIVIQSTTGTGKTTATAIHTATYLQSNPQYKILSIIDRVILANQHIKSFSDQGIQMTSYKNNKFNFDNYVVCINSLLKVSDLKDSYDIRNYIVYIDEIEGFLNFTHNEQLNKNMKQIYLLLIYIIKNCHKIIVSDAIISDNVINLFNSIYNDKSNVKSIFINNSFKKYNNIPAIKINDENVFIDIIKQHIKQNKYFMFLSDSATIINKLYHECFVEEKKDQFFIYMDGHKTEIIYDPSVQLLNKFVFATPSIERGLDFSIPNAQDVFIYITGRSINSQGIFQQTTRTRNINTLYYYGDIKNYPAKYNTLDDVFNVYLTNIEQNNILNNLCMSINENDEIQFVNNTFFKLFCYNEYKNDTLNTNIVAHYEQQLIDNGFILTTEGNNKKLDSEIKNNINQKIIAINDQLFNEFVNDHNVRHKHIYDKLNERIVLLKLPRDNPEILIKFKEQITDPFKLLKHYNIMRFFKNDTYIEDKIKLLIINNFDCKILNNIYNKIKLIRTIQSKYNIIDFDVKGDYIKNKITKDEYNLIKSTFRLTRNIPTNNGELILMYVTMIKHICGSDIIKSKQVQNNNEKFMVYKYNNEHLEFHYSLASYYSTKNITLDPFDDNIQNKNTDNKVIKTKITLKKLNFDLDGLLFYIKDGKLFLNSYFIDKNINLDDK
jgi:hypothetical protein